ncbi:MULTISPECIES: SIS domain-containing protein [Acidiphilium]|uniref:D-sedoheptulose-7-phosphate isomerase n=1 Tax=Acidiphilium TaxID=522 RepID=UPI0025805399|nr:MULTISPECIES: SIS domain-containing protein [Acidiphilium]HQT86152.1 SIS domain-containing protein [Acidiphilium rubrum]
MRNNSKEAERIVSSLQRAASLKLALAEDPMPIIAVVEACDTAIRAGNKLLFCGNGGSASDSQHLATELLIRLRGSVVRNSWPAISLTLDASALTAAGNDFGFDEVFARPLSGLGRAGDVLFGITTSGRSPSVVRALQVGREMGITTVGLLGGDGGAARALCDHALLVPDFETMRIQECHIALGHIILELLEDRLIGADR